jgi:hypothetical protein
MTRITFFRSLSRQAKRAIALVAAISLICFPGIVSRSASNGASVPVEFLEISPNNPSMGIGGKITFRVTIHPPNATDRTIDWMIGNSISAYIVKQESYYTRVLG